MNGKDMLFLLLLIAVVSAFFMVTGSYLAKKSEKEKTLCEGRGGYYVEARGMEPLCLDKSAVLPPKR